MFSLRCPALLAVLLFSSLSQAYEIYQIEKFACANSKTMGVVIAYQVGFVPEKDPKWYPKYYCDSKALSGVTSADQGTTNAAKFKKCLDDSSSWVQACYDKEFKSKCLDGKFVLKTCMTKIQSGKSTDAASGDEPETSR